MDINLSIINVNTSTTLFSSVFGDQAFNATILPGEIITIGLVSPVSPVVDEQCSISGILETFPTIFAFIPLIVLIIIGGIIIALTRREFDVISTLQGLAIGLVSFFIIGFVAVVLANAVCIVA